MRTPSSDQGACKQKYVDVAGSRDLGRVLEFITGITGLHQLLHKVGSGHVFVLCGESSLRTLRCRHSWLDASGTWFDLICSWFVLLEAVPA